MDTQEQLLTIQQLSLKLRIPKPTLRYWEKEFEGILVPLRTEGGQRRYSGETISVIEEINKLRKRGKSLAEIKRTLCSSEKREISNPNSFDLLAARVAEIVKAEVNRFFNGCRNGLDQKIFILPDNSKITGVVGDDSSYVDMQILGRHETS